MKRLKGSIELNFQCYFSYVGRTNIVLKMIYLAEKLGKKLCGIQAIKGKKKPEQNSKSHGKEKGKKLKTSLTVKIAYTL
jgi:hypothetical protein